MELCHWDSLQQEQEQAKSPIQKDLRTKKKKLKMKTERGGKRKPSWALGHTQNHTFPALIIDLTHFSIHWCQNI